CGDGVYGLYSHGLTTVVKQSLRIDGTRVSGKKKATLRRGWPNVVAGADRLSHALPTLAEIAERSNGAHAEQHNAGRFGGGTDGGRSLHRQVRTDFRTGVVANVLDDGACNPV